MIATLETKRLTLRALEPADAAALVEFHSVPANIAFIGKNTLSVAETSRKIVDHIAENEPHGLGLRAALLNETAVMIGRAGLFRSVIEGIEEIELAYLFDRDHWGNGLATEAAARLVSHGVKDLGIDRVIAIIHPENTGSLRVAEKCGFYFERTLNEHKDFGMVYMFAISAITNSDRTVRPLHIKTNCTGAA